jgi:hypothetical protein
MTSVTGFVRWWRRTAARGSRSSEVGAGTVSAGLAMGAAALVITGGAADFLTPVTGERAVCLVRSVTPLEDGAGCDVGAREPRLPLTLVQDSGGRRSRRQPDEDLEGPLPPSDTLIEEALRDEGNQPPADLTDQQCMERLGLDPARCAAHNRSRRQVWERQQRGAEQRHLPRQGRRWGNYPVKRRGVAPIPVPATGWSDGECSRLGGWSVEFCRNRRLEIEQAWPE